MKLLSKRASFLPHVEECRDVAAEAFANEGDPLGVELVLLLQRAVDGQVHVVGANLEDNYIEDLSTGISAQKCIQKIAWWDLIDLL